MRTLDDPPVLADDRPLGDHHDAVGIDPQADRTVGEGGGHAVAVAVEVHEAGWRDPLSTTLALSKGVEEVAGGSVGNDKEPEAERTAWRCWRGGSQAARAAAVARCRP